MARNVKYILIGMHEGASPGPLGAGSYFSSPVKTRTACVKEVERQSFDFAVEDVLPEILTQVRTCGIVVTL